YVFTDHIGLSSRGLTPWTREQVMPHPACSPMTSGTRHDARVHEVTAREAPGSIRPARSFPSLALPIAAFVLGAAIFAFYLLVYRIRLFPVPVGFDTSWYVWRARYVGEHGLGPLDTAVRPGHALLSSVLGSVTGRSQLELASLLPLVLVSAFALAVGALVSMGLGARRWRWA